MSELKPTRRVIATDDREQRRAVRVRVCIDAEAQGDKATPANGLQ